jgi:hypothetical protein
MAELTPLFMDINAVYSGDELGLPYRDLLGEGIVAATDLAVTQRAAGANLSVDVAAGACWVAGDTNVARQPTYRCLNDATVNKGIAPDPSNPRRVLVVAQITDEGFAGTGRNWQIVAIHGTPAASPTLPATPASALPLADIAVAANATSITNANITDKRVRAAIGGGNIPGGGGEVGYAEITANVAASVVAQASAVTIVALPAITFDGTSTYLLQFFGVVLVPTSASCYVNLWDATTDLGYWNQAISTSAGQQNFTISLSRRITPSAGSHTFIAKAWSTTTAATIVAGPGTGSAVFQPAFLRCVKV